MGLFQMIFKKSHSAFIISLCISIISYCPPKRAAPRRSFSFLVANSALADATHAYAHAAQNVSTAKETLHAFDEVPGNTNATARDLLVRAVTAAETKLDECSQALREASQQTRSEIHYSNGGPQAGASAAAQDAPLSASSDDDSDDHVYVNTADILAALKESSSDCSDDDSDDSSIGDIYVSTADVLRQLAKSSTPDSADGI